MNVSTAHYLTYSNVPLSLASRTISPSTMRTVFTPAAMKTMKAPDAYRFPALPFIDVPMARKMLDDVEYATSRRFTSV